MIKANIGHHDQHGLISLVEIVSQSKAAGLSPLLELCDGYNYWLTQALMMALAGPTIDMPATFLPPKSNLEGH